MTWIVLSIVLGIITIGAFLGASNSSSSDAGIGYAVGGVAIFAWLILTFFLCIHKVGQTEVGVVYNFSGTISGQKDPGVVTTWPWQHIRTQSVAITKETFTFSGDNKAVSKDQQPITAVVVVNYQVTGQDVIGLLKVVGPNWATVLLDGRVPQDFKETTATFTSPEITQQRPRLRTDTLARLKRELCPSPEGSPNKDKPWCIDVVDVFISNVGYSDEYTKAIEAKQVQVQQAQQAQAKVAQARAEADQKVATARGEAQSILLKANADAQALRVKGKALSQNPEILKLEAIDKLNPQATVIFCGGGKTDGSSSCPSFFTGK